MNTLTLILPAFFISLIVGLFLVPAIKKVAKPLGLIDKPNLRKTHKDATPVIGGLAVFISSTISLLILSTLIAFPIHYLSVAIGATVLLLVGIVDDRYQLKASTRLIIQLGVALFVAINDFRLTSFYGIFDVYELSYYESLSLTVLLIVGVVNAVNLLDGIDGLAGLFGVLGFSLFALVSYLKSNYSMVVVSLVLVASLLVFLKHNFSKKKMFMGDGGSLLIGFLMVCFSLDLLSPSDQIAYISQNIIVALVIGLFIVPVFDSLRVYWTRIQTGYSPFRADRTHIHHITLALNVSHKRAAILVVGLMMVIIGLSVVGTLTVGTTLTLFIVFAIFILITAVFYANMRLKEWKTKIQIMEYLD